MNVYLLEDEVLLIEVDGWGIIEEGGNSGDLTTAPGCAKLEKRRRKGEPMRGDPPKGFGWAWSKTEVEKLRLCRVANDARGELFAARTALENCEYRDRKAQEAVDAFNNRQKKCECNVCPNCGKEK